MFHYQNVRQNCEDRKVGKVQNFGYDTKTVAFMK